MKLGPKQQAWVDALRSGKYVQGQGALIQERAGYAQYCCLGVACEVALSDVKRAGFMFHFNGRQDKQFMLPIEQENELKLQTEAIQEIAALDEDEVEESFTVAQELLARLNDKAIPKTFAEIADIIEEHADTLFTEPT